jgi:hypothetical protein
MAAAYPQWNCSIFIPLSKWARLRPPSPVLYALAGPYRTTVPTPPTPVPIVPLFKACPILSPRRSPLEEAMCLVRRALLYEKMRLHEKVDADSIHILRMGRKCARIHKNTNHHAKPFFIQLKTAATERVKKTIFKLTRTKSEFTLPKNKIYLPPKSGIQQTKQTSSGVWQRDININKICKPTVVQSVVSNPCRTKT